MKNRKIEKLQKRYIKKISRLYMSMLFTYLKLERNCEKLAKETSPELASLVKEEAKKVVRLNVPQDVIDDILKNFSDFVVKERREEKEEESELNYIR